MIKVYDYYCNNCNHTFEEWMESVDAEVRCTHCDSASVVRKLSTPAVIIEKDAYERYLHKRPPDNRIVGKPITKVFKTPKE